jgi:hypothetical protein
MTCSKQRYDNRHDAVSAAKRTRRALLDMGWFRVYRCTTCRKTNGQRAWHWGHVRSYGRRRTS